MDLRAEARRVLEVLEEDGWCRGAHLNPITRQKCLRGAIRAAVFGTRGPLYGDDETFLRLHFYRWRAVRKYKPMIALYEAVLDQPVPWWNDDIRRTYAQVVEACKSVIAEADRRFYEGDEG